MIEPRVEDFVDELQPIAAEIGVDIAWALARLFGATRVYVPRKWHEGLDFNAIGEDAARLLCERFGPERIDIPRVPFTQAALQRIARTEREAGHSNGRIARQLGLSYRTVSRLAGGRPALTRPVRQVNDSRQIDIIDWIDGQKSGR